MRNFKVTGMTCGHCARSVTAAVKSIDPEAVVDVNLAGKKVLVDSKADDESLRRAIEEEGYQVEAIYA